MSGVHKLQPTLRRIVVVRQATKTAWRVEGYERLGRGWRYTWLLCPNTTVERARDAAWTLSRAMGLPVAEQALGEKRFRLFGGTLGVASRRIGA